MSVKDISNEDTGRFINHKAQVGAIEHFLKLNSLKTLQLEMKRHEFDAYAGSPNKLIPIYLRSFGRSSTAVYIKNFEYDYDTQTLTVAADEILKYIQ